MCTSRHPPVPEGHFHDDPSMSTVVLTHHIDTESPTHPTRSRVSHLLIPCAALRAQIRVIFDSDSKPDPLAPPRLVPWRDWGPHASLRLMLPVHPHPNHISKYVSLVPYGSRMPVVTFDDAGCTRASVYVFDINPLVARHSKHILTQVQSGSGNMTTTTAIVEDVEAALPGVVDPENSAIPFVMYRFGIPLPAMVGSTWRVIEAVRMSMTGFTVTVCRYFEEVVRSNLYLQYKIELAQNGMVNGYSSILSISERLQRLREYASRFRDGIFDHEDLAAHPHYTHQVRSLPQNPTLTQNGRYGMALSVFTPGSAQAGIQSSRYLLPIGRAGKQGLIISRWAIDEAQDLLVMVETADLTLPEQLRRRPDEFCIHFYSLIGWKMTGPTAHPAAALPSLHFFAPPSMHHDIRPIASIVQLHITGQYVIWELATKRYSGPDSVSVEVCNWRTGEVISRIDIGAQAVDVFPLDYPYLLTLPKDLEEDRHFDIYTFSPSGTPNHRICTLQLPEEHVEDDEQIEFHFVYTGDQSQPSEGHFHADLSQSTVVLQFFIEGIEGNREVHYLIPRTTFLAQIREAEARKLSLDQTEGGVLPVPWAAWGSQSCLRLSLYRQHAIHRARVVPFGSRFPLLVVGESDFRSAAVYVFDVNPLVARREKRLLLERQRGPALAEPGSAGIVEDIEAVLPGVVDPNCSSIPYVVYRFELPYGPVEWQFGHKIGSVIMSMTGFTVKLVIWPYHNSKLPSPSTYGTPSTLSTVASSSSSTSFPVSNTPLVVRLADGTLHHLVPTDTLTDSSPPSPSSTPPIPIPPPHLRYRSPAPSSDSDLDSPRPASTTAVDSDSDYDSDPNDLHATGTIAVSRVINPAHVFFLQTTINTPLFRGSERTAYVARSQYPIVPGHVIFRFPAARATTTTPAYPAYTLYGILALIEPTYFVFHMSLIPYVTNYITTLHITPSTE
ncbi:hypothetical protein GSI_02755 [Ganoderma sinense ZZ0214-1]|uniref:Uncharacterized protein n=1 Tax=Ganoderma sinense ZZ0214-1 TaxID=1077348 RepID=A0A2G8SN16_9APHY|nr:hypothetical protein GSI_02755 [Ganoderma sinense ZZ0214-1]